MTNPFSKLSPRSIRVIYTLLTLIVLGLCLLNFSVQMFERVTGNDQCRWIDTDTSKLLIREIVSGGVAEHAGIKDGDFLVKINGESFKTSQEAQLRINKLAGSYAIYSIERNGVQFDTRVLILKYINLGYFGQFLFGLGFLLVGYVVVIVKPLGKIQRMFARYSIYSMLFFGFSVFNINPQTDPYWRVVLFGFMSIFTSIFAPPPLVRFFLFFPVKRKWHSSRVFTIILYSISFLLVVGIIVNGILVRGPQWLTLTFLFTRYAFFFTGFAIFVRSYFAFVPKEQRVQLRPVLIGVAIGLILFTYAFAVQTLIPFAAFLNPTILLPMMLLVVVPMFFGYAIFRHRLMDVDVVIRRSLIYGTVTAALAAIYLVSVYGIGTLVNYFFGVQDNQLLVVVSLVVVAFVFDPVKQRFQNGIDRVFFHERYDYQQALLEFTQELPRLMEMEHILHSIVSRLSSTMHIEKISVFICGEKEGCNSAAQNLDQTDCMFSDGEHTLMALLQKTRKPADLHLLGDEYDLTDLKSEEKEKLLRSGIVLAVPMFLQDRLVGFINVGPKMSGKVYSQEDINLLATVAGQAAIAIENSRLHKSEIDQQRVKEELDLARKIQQGLFPKTNPVISGLDISGVSVPALSVGGDYYDFIQLSPNKILAVVADVSGKGMSAALYMSKVQGMVQLAAHIYKTPKEMLTNINRRIFDGMDRRSFITMILALFDMKKKEVRICRAGHNKALLGVNGKFRFLEGGGIGLGLERGPVFEDAIEEVRIPIKPESLFLFYTDGITEAMNEKKQQLGETAIVDVLKAKRHLSAESIQHAILTRVGKFRGSAEQHDDVTMVVVKSKNEKNNSRK
ncbi:MAG: SpoIIE family protein phosphatase [Ignavibacteriales bacterium]|nr:SpoIIE family protein phosphatase [Ignavibacteriales bacterium]